MEDFDNTEKYATYKQFAVDDEKSVYKLTVGGYQHSSTTSSTVYVFQIQDVVLDTLHQMGFILIYNNECYFKPDIRRVGCFILI
jgi:hypothetical protein